MIYTKNEISNHLLNLGVKSNDTVMLHGNAGIVGQYNFQNKNDAFDEFIGQLICYLFEGTIIVPTFTYSATKNEIFDKDKTESSIGLFSEKFRLIKGAVRSQHPIFSISAIGKNSKYFTETRIDDCFGEDTVFDKIYKKNVKILTLGCSLDRVTFVHYVEQKLNVSYRYNKKYKARICNKGVFKNLDINYFVRKLDINSKIDLKSFEKNAIAEKKLIIKPFGRFLARSILAKDLFEIASKLLLKNEYALIEEGAI